MPGIAEINGGIYFCGKPLKTRLETLLSFFSLYATVDQKFYNWAKVMPVLAGRLVKSLEVPLYVQVQWTLTWLLSILGDMQ